MKVVLGALLFTSLLLASSPSQGKDVNRSKLSFGAGVTVIFDDFDRINVSFEESKGATLFLSYQAGSASELAIEYLFIDGFEGSVNGINAFVLDGYALTFSQRLYYMSGRVRPYGLFGLGWSELDFRDTLGSGISISESSVIFRVGFGLEVSLSEMVFLFTEASYFWFFDNDFFETDYIPITTGMKYRF